MNSQLTKFDVFISHSAATKDVAKHFYYNLQANGQHAWFDVAQLEAGLPLKAELQKGVSNSKTYLLLHSQEATESDFVAIELMEALKQRELGNLKIVVLNLDNSALPRELRGDFWLAPRLDDFLAVFQQTMEHLSGSSPLLSLTRSAFLGQQTYEKDVAGNSTWDLVLRHHLLLAGQIKSLISSPGKSAEETFSTLQTLSRISIFRDLPFAQNIRSALGNGCYEHVFPVRMRIVPKITVIGLPERYALIVVETTEIHAVIQVINKRDGTPQNQPVPYILEFNADF